MAQVELEKKYNCFDDCDMAGCPGHKAKLTFFTVNNGYAFDNGKGLEFSAEQGTLEVLVQLLKDLQDRRADSLKI